MISLITDIKIAIIEEIQIALSLPPAVQQASFESISIVS
jgi:hypothetical protein